MPIANRDAYDQCSSQLGQAGNAIEDIEHVLGAARFAVLQFADSGEKQHVREFVGAMAKASRQYADAIAHLFEALELAGQANDPPSKTETGEEKTEYSKAYSDGYNSIRQAMFQHGILQVNSNDTFPNVPDKQAYADFLRGVSELLGVLLKAEEKSS